MPIILDPGAVLERPGVGIVIGSAEQYVNPARGVVGCLVRSRMGPLNLPTKCTNVAEIQRVFGGGAYGGGNGNTTDLALEALRGGAVAVWIVRMGSGGAPATLSLPEDNAGVAGALAIQVDAKGPGTDGNLISVAIQGA